MNFMYLFSTFLVTSLSLVALKPVALHLGLIDQPGGRKTHALPTPLIGGLGIYLGVVFITSFIPEIFQHYGPLLLLSTVILLIGILDDMREIPASIRMGSQALAAVLMCLVAGNELSGLGNLLGLGMVSLGILSIPVTTFATAGVINAINMSDGLDGLSGGMLLIALAFLGIMAYDAGNTTMMGFIAILICSLLAFLALNFRLPWNKPAMVYLGDAGSTFLGFMLAWLLIEATQGENAVMPPVLALWFLAVPLIDTVALLIKRPLEGKSPFHPGRDHLHHKLHDLGLPTKKVVLTLYLAGVTLALTGLTAYQLGVPEPVLFLAFLALFGAYLYALKSTRLAVDLPKASS